MTLLLRKVAEALTETTIDDEVVVMKLSDGDFFSLQGTARAIWQRIDGTRDREALLADLADEYGDGVERAQVLEFLDTLCGAGLIDG